MKATVKFKLPESVKSKAIGGELKLTCQYSYSHTTSLEQFLSAVYAATGNYPMTFVDRHTKLEEAWIPLEWAERALVGRKELLEKLEWLAS